MREKNSLDLIIGPIHMIDRAEKPSPGVMLRIPAINCVQRKADNSIFLSRDKLLRVQTIEVVDPAGLVIGTFEASLDQLFQNMCSTEKSYQTHQLERFGISSEAYRQFVPLFLWTSEGADSFETIYSQLRFSETDMLFIKTEHVPAVEKPSEGSSFAGKLELAIESHQKHFVFLGNHQCYYKKMENGIESEYKLTFTKPSDPWRLCVEIYEAVKTGQLKDFILEYKDEFQKWDYMNHLYEITGSDAERGYVSFIPQTNGKFTIKRKIYKQDQLSRRELHTTHVSIPEGIPAYLDEHYPFEIKAYPPFRRTRYDINLESLATGNVFGIFFDRVTVSEGSQELYQCEIEYLRTRSLFENESYKTELEAVSKWTKAFLDVREQSYEENFYSKLSFMRDHYSEIGGAL